MVSNDFSDLLSVLILREKRKEKEISKLKTKASVSLFMG